jgi:hypothetical protein
VHAHRRVLPVIRLRFGQSYAGTGADADKARRTEERVSAHPINPERYHRDTPDLTSAQPQILHVVRRTPASSGRPAPDGVCRSFVQATSPRKRVAEARPDGALETFSNIVRAPRSAQAADPPKRAARRRFSE